MTDQKTRKTMARLKAELRKTSADKFHHGLIVVFSSLGLSVLLVTSFLVLAGQ